MPQRLATKIESKEAVPRLAVLIDADNTQATVIEGLFAEITRLGDATVRRIYGNFSVPTSASLKKILQEYAIKTVHQFSYTTGKNATDSTLIIEAMDLLYTRKFDGFCLITSDSDFTGLAMRLREEGLTVYGFGEKKTPEAFRNACHEFVFTETLRSTKVIEPIESLPKNKDEQRSNPIQTSTEAIELKLDKNILTALEQSSDKAGWSQVGTFGSFLTKLKPDSDSKFYGHKKLSDLISANSNLLVVEERQVPGSDRKNFYLRAK